MLRIIQCSSSLPVSYPCDATSVFQPGQIGQLKLVGNDIVAGLSDGTAPFGIIDDVRTNAFTQPAIDEVVIIKANGITTDGYGKYFTQNDAKQELNNPSIQPHSFVCDYEGLVLNPKNGILTLPAGSELNWDSDGDHKEDSVKTICNYVYEVPSIPGENSVVGSGRLTMWYARGIYSTDVYDTLQRYPLNATLFVNEYGKLTTKQNSSAHVGIAMVTASPSSLVNQLEFLWL